MGLGGWVCVAWWVGLFVCFILGGFGVFFARWVGLLCFWVCDGVGCLMLCGLMDLGWWFFWVRVCVCVL